MQRSEEQLETLIQGLAAHHGENTHSLVSEIAHAHASESDQVICAMVASMLGGDPYNPPVRILQRPLEPNSASAHQRHTSPARTTPNTPTSPSRPAHKTATSILPTNPSANPFDALTRKAPPRGANQPLQTVWKTVVSETQAPTYEHQPTAPTSAPPSQFEDVDMDSLQDVDPVEFQIAQNPDYFSYVAPPSHYEKLPPSACSANSPELSNSKAKEAGSAPEQTPMPDLAAQTLILDSDDEDPAPHLQFPSSSENQPEMVLPDWLMSSVSFVTRNRLSTVPNPFKDQPATSSSQHQTNSIASTPSEEKKLNTSSVEIWIPSDQSSEEQSRRLQEKMALGASGDSLRASQKWSASGEFPIAPSPSTLRQSLAMSSSSVSIQPPEEVIDLTHIPDEKEFVLDTEALNFLGSAYPDFDLSYLADCLRGANNDIVLVSQFLDPVEMEQIVDDMDPDLIEIDDDELHQLPEEDAAFNENYIELVAMFPDANRDWILDALLDTDNDLERAADLVMRSLEPTPGNMDVQEDSEPKKNETRAAKKARARQARKMKLAKKALVVPPPNAWARPVRVQSDAPLSKFPICSNDVPEYYDGQKEPIRIRAQPPAPAPPKPQVVMQILRDVSAEDREHGDGDWRMLMAKANHLFELATGGRQTAVKEFARLRKSGEVEDFTSQFRASNESWIKLVERAGELFYQARASKLDLRGLRLRPASKLVAAILQTHWLIGTESRSIEFITGRGLHSAGGVSMIREAVRSQTSDYFHVWTNPGAVLVTLPRPLR